MKHDDLSPTKDHVDDSDPAIKLADENKPSFLVSETLLEFIPVEVISELHDRLSSVMYSMALDMDFPDPEAELKDAIQGAVMKIYDPNAGGALPRIRQDFLEELRQKPKNQQGFFCKPQERSPEEELFLYMRKAVENNLLRSLVRMRRTVRLADDGANSQVGVIEDVRLEHESFSETKKLIQAIRTHCVGKGDHVSVAIIDAFWQHRVTKPEHIAFLTGHSRNAIYRAKKRLRTIRKQFRKSGSWQGLG